MTMRRLLRVLAALALTAAAAPALATNGMRMIGFSPVQNGMGGVGVGATLDSGTVLTNPAGMTELDRRLDIGLTWFQPTVEYKATGAAPGFVTSDGTTMDSNRGGSPVPNVALVVPLGSGFTAGIGAFGVGGMGVDYKSNLYSGVTLTSYQNLRVAPAIAYQVNELFSAGLSLNAMWAQMKYDVAGGFGQVPHDTANSFGYGATLGVKVTPMKELTFGAAYETKSSFQDFSFTVPSHVVQTPSGAVTVPGGTDKLAFDQPAVLSGGVAWRAVPALLVAVDVQWINWSAVMGKNKPQFTSDTSTTGSMPFNMSWDDQVVYKVGAEWAATPELKVRAGYDYGKKPLNADRAFENIAFPAVTEHHVTLGLGWSATDRLVINVAGMYSPKASLSGANAQEQGLVAYQSSMSQFSLDLGAAWRF
jgi:long-chain fatty acid transport protein